MNINVVKYGEKCVAVMPEVTKDEQRLINAKGLPNPNLNRNGKKAHGWIFSKKTEDKNNNAGEKLAKEQGLEWEEYSDRSMVAWTPNKLSNALRDIDCWKKFNSNLTNPETNEKQMGWVFPKKEDEKVKKAIQAA